MQVAPELGDLPPVAEAEVYALRDAAIRVLWPEGRHVPLLDADRRRLLTMAYLGLAVYGRQAMLDAARAAHCQRKPSVHYAWGIMRKDAACAPGGEDLFTLRSDAILKRRVPCPWRVPIPYSQSPTTV